MHVVDSPKKWINEFVLFLFLLFTANKSNLFVHFLGESTASQFCFWFYLTFTTCRHWVDVILHCKYQQRFFFISLAFQTWVIYHNRLFWFYNSLPWCLIESWHYCSILLCSAHKNPAQQERKCSRQRPLSIVNVDR